jgi:beta-hydroxyacyl-ACP dehydratase FabZ
MSTLNIDEIMKLLPHRYPMLLVDKIIECDDQKRIVGIKNVSMNEPHFQGHFPGMPIMPGVLQLEAMAQTAGILANRIAKVAGVLPYFLTIDKAKFRKVIKPGDQMRIEVEIITIRSKAVKFQAKVMVDGVLASEAEMMCMLTDQKASQ